MVKVHFGGLMELSFQEIGKTVSNMVFIKVCKLNCLGLGVEISEDGKTER